MEKKLLKPLTLKWFVRLIHYVVLSLSVCVTSHIYNLYVKSIFQCLNIDFQTW